MKTPIYYKYDAKTSEYIRTVTAQKDPSKTGVFLIPANATTKAPPKKTPGNTVIFKNDNWQSVADNRGKTIYSTKDKQSKTQETIGDIETGFTLQKPTNLQLWSVKNNKWIDNIILAQQEKLQELTKWYNKEKQGGKSYDLDEHLTFQEQYTEALKVQQNSQEATPIIDALATARGEAKATLATKILDHHIADIKKMGELIGKRYKFTKLINACKTIQELKSLIFS